MDTCPQNACLTNDQRQKTGKRYEITAGLWTLPRGNTILKRQHTGKK